ncbi:GroES-like protein [Penicillium cosmopolitanum]|uniref:GroES-like protein n=1 Tax=Penicillium cosmopolitanum TaxID=1131564 RepID=A0A9W9W105_9EURO|nr:GroES-like protein [Penicillium cosmopolitanum]KAJ5396491.1 GroES-like protein [Penicillium cosmopolitanum]
MSDSMNAIVITKFGGPEVLEHKIVPKPTVRTGEVLVAVKAFGLNHAEMHMRKGEWDEWNPITGLECVGVVEACPGGEFREETDRGGYGEFAAVPVTNVIAVQTSLPWEELAAIPEIYITVWSCLFTVLDLQKGERILIRGATSTLGQAAVNLAVSAGARVTATTRRQERFELLKQMGAAETIIEQAGLDRIHTVEFDKVLNLIGNRVLLESINLTKSGGRMLQAGWLGGLDPVPDFNPMLQMKSGVHFSLFHGKVLGSSGFPFSEIPLQQIVHQIENGEWDARPTHVFDYQEIRKAHGILDSGDAGGKIVVKRC